VNSICFGRSKIEFVDEDEFEFEIEYGAQGADILKR
jgi:hypothetical protein